MDDRDPLEILAEKEKQKNEKAAGLILEQARKGITRNLSYLLMPACMLETKSVEEEVPLCTDGRTLFYNPEWVIQAYREDPQKVEYMLVHLLFHCLLLHPFRRPQQEPERSAFDAAADYIVAQILNDTKEAKRRYGKLVPTVDEDEWDSPISPYGSVEQRTRKAAATMSGLRDTLSAGKALVGDSHTLWNAKKSVLKIMRAAGEGTEEQKWNQIRKDWLNMASKIVSGHDFGSVPSSLKRLIQTETDSSTDYNTLLQKLCCPVRERTKPDPDIFDYGQYYLGLDLLGDIPFIEPSETRENKEPVELVVAIDTSGSCQDGRIERFLKETLTLLRAFTEDMGGYRVHLIQCDCKIQEMQVITQDQDPAELLSKFCVKGGGGTNFTPIFRVIAREREQGRMRAPDALLLMTDGCGEFPAEAPDYRCAAIMTQEDAEQCTMLPQWMEKFVIDD